MAYVSVTNVSYNLDPNGCPATENLSFEITLEVNHELEQDLEWKLVFVGSARTNEHDQVLDSIDIGPLSPSTVKFIFDAPAPNLQLVPAEDRFEVAVIYFSVSYREQEFVRIGYYMRHEYDCEELVENPPDELDIRRVKRTLDMANPHLTRYPIMWDNVQNFNTATLSDVSAVPVASQ
jgi:histone chaperone ASF1